MDFEENDRVVGGISGNDDDGGSDRVIYEFDPFARVPAATLDAPHCWLLVFPPANAAHGGDTVRVLARRLWARHWRA